MSESHFSFTRSHTGFAKRLITEVEVFSDVSGTLKSVTVKAVWDTGATISAITPETAKKLNLMPINRIPISGVNNTTKADVVSLSIRLPNGISIEDRQVAVCTLNSTINMIIGMDIILMGDFAISNGGNQTQFSFAIPPFKHKIDFERWTD